jgi:hypothetical protein
MWRNTADGSIAMWLLNGTAVTATTTMVGPGGWRVVP